MNTTLKVFAVILIARSAFAQINFSNRVDLSRRAEVETIQKITKRVQNGDRSVCVGYMGSDMSGCAKVFIRSYRVHSAEAVRAMFELVTVAAKYDVRTAGQRKAALLLADDYLTVVEHVTPQRFFAQTIRAKTRRDRLMKDEAKRRENEELNRVADAAVPQLEEHLKMTSLFGSRNRRSVTWEESKEQEIRQRLQRLKGMRWKIADNS